MSPRVDPVILKQQVDALLKTLADIDVEGNEIAPAPAMAAAAISMRQGNVTARLSWLFSRSAPTSRAGSCATTT